MGIYKVKAQGTYPYPGVIAVGVGWGFAWLEGGEPDGCGSNMQTKSAHMLACYQVLVLKELFGQHTSIYKMEKRKTDLYPRVVRPLVQEVCFFPLYSLFLSSKIKSRIQKQINFNLNFFNG